MPAQPVASTSDVSHSHNAPSRVVLAIDYGHRRIGLALSDALGITARPLTTFVRTNRRRDLARLRELCREHGVTAILVGLPLHMDGRRSAMADEAARFADRVRKTTGLPVEMVDERLSSWEAEQFPSAQGTHRGQSVRKTRNKRPLDELAAAVILRDYLSRRQDGREIRS